MQERFCCELTIPVQEGVLGLSPEMCALLYRHCRCEHVCTCKRNSLPAHNVVVLHTITPGTHTCPHTCIFYQEFIVCFLWCPFTCTYNVTYILHTHAYNNCTHPLTCIWHTHNIPCTYMYICMYTYIIDTYLFTYHAITYIYVYIGIIQHVIAILIWVVPRLWG